MGNLIEPPPPTELTQVPIRREEEEDTNASSLRGGSSAKIDQLVHLLQLTPATRKVPCILSVYRIPGQSKIMTMA